ncbi:MAG: hypothetical protein ACJ8D4_13275, partial [Xanthobacteraceae bacterium]
MGIILSRLAHRYIMPRRHGMIGRLLSRVQIAATGLVHQLGCPSSPDRTFSQHQRLDAGTFGF